MGHWSVSAESRISCQSNQIKSGSTRDIKTCSDKPGTQEETLEFPFVFPSAVVKFKNWPAVKYDLRENSILLSESSKQ